MIDLATVGWVKPPTVSQVLSIAKLASPVTTKGKELHTAYFMTKVCYRKESMYTVCKEVVAMAVTGFQHLLVVLVQGLALYNSRNIGSSCESLRAPLL